MKKFKIIISNLCIIISYIFIEISFGIHGWDDQLLYTYYFKPNMTFIETLILIKDQCITWNFRFGEIISYILGAFPNIVFILLFAIVVDIYVNLIVFYALGKKRFFSSEYKNVLILLIYIVCMYFYPSPTDVFFWMNSACNHLLGVTLLLILGIPYRNYFDDNKNPFENMNKIYYIFYLIACFILAFYSEGAIVLFIFVTVLTNVKKYVDDKKVDVKLLLNFIFVLLGFIVFFIFSITRINYQTNSWIKFDVLSNFIDFIYRRKIYFIFTFIAIIMYIAITKFKDKKEFIKNLKLLLISMVAPSVIIIFLYYSDRGTLVFDTFLASMICFCIHSILDSIRLKNTILNLILTTIFIVLIIIITSDLVHIFKDFNNFAKNRINEIESSELYDLNSNLYIGENVESILYNWYSRYIYNTELEELNIIEINYRYRILFNWEQVPKLIYN